MKPDYRLPRRVRISDDATASALRAAQRVQGHWFVVRRIPTDLGHARLLVRVAKRVMKSAAERNRMRRCVKEVFRHQRAALCSFDYFVSLVHPYGREDPLAQARHELERLLCASGGR